MSYSHFEQFLSDSFKDGVAVRELRLSHDEVNYIKTSYPKAMIISRHQRENADGRYWYEVCLHGLIPNEEKMYESMDAKTLHTEKEQLLQELAATKNELDRVKKELEMIRHL